MKRQAVAASLLAALSSCRSPQAASAAPAPRESSRPPIDCPLHQQGVAVDRMRPFDEVEKYVAFLERPDRAQWQKPDELVEALGLRPGETVADVGAGSGYFSFRFAAKLPQGRVVAIDLEPEMLRHIHHKAMSVGVENLEVRVAAPDDPKVPAEASLVFICDVLHHVSDPASWLGKLHGEMTAGARLAIVEFKEGDLPQGPPASMKSPKRGSSSSPRSRGSGRRASARTCSRTRSCSSSRSRHHCASACQTAFAPGESAGPIAAARTRPSPDTASA